MAEDQTATAEQEKQSPPFPLKVLLGQKVGMARIFSAAGEKIPVSVIYTGTCVATGLRTKEKDGYDAVQLGAGECKEKNLEKPLLGNFKKLNIPAVKWLKEFRVDDREKIKDFPAQLGRKVECDLFSPGDYVDVSGVSRGKGFAGAMKRHGFAGGPTSHGASDKVRAPGSSAGGSGAPQRVYLGTRRAGRMGGDWVTSQKIEVVKIDKENHLIMVKGSVPGPSQGFVVVKETTRALKHKRVQAQPEKSAKKAAVKKPAKPAAKAPAK